ncbi:hypothetical protein [Photobacterium leiognathi]|uniref:hypothetical protein n=1 Tax=Photobacterium leiognathi TaxID=553611 RepID=UPI0027386017|nr:hypothetical protein [Photobacterium leiognathi]
MSEVGIAIAFDPTNDTITHQMVKSVLNNNNTTAQWGLVTAMLKSFALQDQAFGAKTSDALASTQNTSWADWWNGSEAPVIGDDAIGYDMVKLDHPIYQHLPGNDIEYVVNRWFTVKQPQVTIPSAAFKDGNAIYQATISITSTSA